MSSEKSVPTWRSLFCQGTWYLSTGDDPWCFRADHSPVLSTLFLQVCGFDSWSWYECDGSSKTDNFATWKFLTRWTDIKRWQVMTFWIFFLIWWPFTTKWWLLRGLMNPWDDPITVNPWWGPVDDPHDNWRRPVDDPDDNWWRLVDDLWWLHWGPLWRQWPMITFRCT